MRACRNIRTGGRRFGVACCTLAAVGVIAGCGSSSSGSSASSGSSGGGSSSAKTTSVTIGIATPVAAFYLPYLAEEKGYFAQNHLNVKVELETPGVLTPALAAGSVPYAVFAAPQVEADHLTQPSVVWLGAWEKTANINMIAAGTSTVAGLRGKPVGVTTPGSESTILVDSVLAKAGLSTSDVQTRELSSSSDELAAFQSGQIDAFVASEPLASEAVHGRKGASIIDPIDEPWTGAGLGGNLSYAKSHVTVTKEVLKALDQALTDWLSSKTDAEKAINMAAPGTPKASLALAYAATKQHFLTSLAVPDRTTETNVLTAMKKYGYPKANPSDWASFSDGSYLPTGSGS